MATPRFRRAVWLGKRLGVHDSRPLGATIPSSASLRASVRQSQKEAAAKRRPISAPTLVIWGERDSYLDLAEPHDNDVPNLVGVERLDRCLPLGASRRG
jgi:pimeloyl-ACP methyl ester carboxylesterase